jgi:signal transduction histidine kinase
MDADNLFQRYTTLQQYVGWSADDTARVLAAAPRLEPGFPELIDDFYAEILRHRQTREVITGGQAQIERLKATLLGWLKELVSGKYDEVYVQRRWKVGYRHVEIGLDQVYTNVALSRLRLGLLRRLADTWSGTAGELAKTAASLHRLLDLDLAIIEDAYQAAYAARLQQAERLAAIGQMAGGVAHELRNPLNVIKTSIYYLLNARNPSPEKRAEHLGRIEKQVGLADAVITALTNFARMPAPDMRPFDVAPCVEEVLQANAVPANIEVVLDISASLPPALADRSQVQIVLGNVIRNAAEAMESGGRLTVSGRRREDHVEIAVSDTGPGISAANLERVMQPLFSTKPRGIGLGLALARGIVAKNHGRLEVASDVGRGSTFTVILPAVCDGERRGVSPTLESP